MKSKFRLKIKTNRLDKQLNNIPVDKNCESDNTIGKLLTAAMTKLIIRTIFSRITLYLAPRVFCNYHTALRLYRATGR